ncbi:MAG: hypothetical protein ACI89T_001778 [Cognaticolwellia sp.]|jgi:hypothetical protein
MNDDLTDDPIPSVEQESYVKDLSKSEQAAHNNEVRKRIENLLEQKRLKYLLDDADDWDIE